MSIIFLLNVGEGPKDDNPRQELSKYPYRAVLSCMFYLDRRIRPDISFSVSLLSRYVEDPGMHHCKASTRLIRYLRGTTNYGLHIADLNGNT